MPRETRVQDCTVLLGASCLHCWMDAPSLARAAEVKLLSIVAELDAEKS